MGGQGPYEVAIFVAGFGLGVLFYALLIAADGVVMLAPHGDTIEALVHENKKLRFEITARSAAAEEHRREMESARAMIQDLSEALSDLGGTFGLK